MVRLCPELGRLPGLTLRMRNQRASNQRAMAPIDPSRRFPAAVSAVAIFQII
jgi:hypothetical protein